MNDPTELLDRVRLDLRERPFTERGSRLLVLADDDGALSVARAEYETPLADTTELTGLRLASAAGEELAVRDARPDGVAFDGGVRLVFADADTLVLVGDGAVARWRTAEGAERSAAVDGVLTLVGGGVQADAPTLIADARDRWTRWFGRMPAVRADLRDRAALAWWTLAVNLLPIRFAGGREGLVPSKFGYVGIWNWDSYFHAVALRHADPELARDQIRILLAHQRADGLIPDVVHDEGVLAETTDLPRGDHARLAEHVGQAVSGGAGQELAEVVPVTKPPLTAWAVWKIHEAAPDREFLAEVYEPIVRSQEWWFAASDPDGDGLAEYLHPYSSGLDDSPVWDYGPRAEPPDLNAYLALQFDVLGDIAEALGRDDDAERWRRCAAEHTALLVERRWDGERFATVSVGRTVSVRTPLELLPLLTGRLPREIADRLHADLRSPAFWGERPVPTVAFDDPAFDPEAMWRGPVWLNVNYLVIEGLRRSGYPDTADELAERTVRMVAGAGGLYEYWNPLTGARAGRATSGFGWSSALFVDLAHQAAGR
ncbi:amylo-alpha-1,6-glucosidase [Yinghuangia seranimata]|uniref:amylo-alpha-1,6-glucosidase n=1 Tax=Yinghuangia seranimata TaxID=408067 RepID=UPI00248B2C51|nr:glycogen debranching protein [Yinghuangia seranimata]MDI2128466.1 glycogen debranching protein [Yinghuangia seranimata]